MKEGKRKAGGRGEGNLNKSKIRTSSLASDLELLHEWVIPKAIWDHTPAKIYFNGFSLIE